MSCEAAQITSADDVLGSDTAVEVPSAKASEAAVDEVIVAGLGGSGAVGEGKLAGDVDDLCRSETSTAGSDGCDTESTVSPSEDASEASQGFGAEETLIVFDWDDTVLPSSWLLSQGLSLADSTELTEHQAEKLAEVAVLAVETLRIAKQFGTVVFVTNAERSWIERSCHKFMPMLFSSLEDIKLLSARSVYETPERPCPLEWKVCAFESEIEAFFGAGAAACPERRKNIMSFGDSVHEREALMRTTAALPNTRSKSLKFVERPDTSQLCMEHSLVQECLHRLVNLDSNLDLQIS